MSKFKLSLALVASTIIGGFSIGSAQASDLSAVPAGSYSVDPTHAYVHVQYNHLGLSNPILAFDEFTLNMNLNNEEPSKTTVALDIKTNSVLTGSDIFHEHLTGKKWFDAATNPSITFSSKTVTANRDGTFALVGDLTIKGITKPVTLDVVINNAMEHPMSKKPVVGVSATGKLLRSDWGLGANAPYVSDEVTIQVQAEMIKS